MEETHAWPVKTREIRCSLVDSTRWNDFDLRDGDVVVTTWAKTGTTWTQQIVWQLQNGGREGVFAFPSCPWVDFRINPEAVIDAAKAQTGRRCLKTHLPLDALKFSPKAKYVYVGRDARDTVWSAYNHQCVLYTDAFNARANATPWPDPAPVGRPVGDVRDHYLRWLDTGELQGFGLSYSFWEHVRGWWEARGLPNLLFVHFDNLKADPEGQIRRIADFLRIEVDPASWPLVLRHCGFDYMRKTAVATAPDDASAETIGGFFHSGTNGRWRDMLSAEEIARCDAVAARHLSADCARWLATGVLPD